MVSPRVTVAGPYFEDVEIGQVFDDAPAMTLTSGHAAVHQAVLGDRMRLPLDGALSQRVTGSAQQLAHPQLVCDVAIGQTTGASERVMANLFYRGLILQRQVHLGDTLRTTSEVVALKQNRSRDGVGSGLVAMRIRTVDQEDRVVLDFYRCPMLPTRDGDVSTAHTSPISGIPEELDLDAVHDAVPRDWDYAAARAGLPAVPGGIQEGTTYVVEARETVSSAPELARLSLNIARTHTDAGAGGRGTRLVYGGHTIGIAAAHLSRAFPSLLTVLAWEGCDHTGPVFEGDVLASELTVTKVERSRYVDADVAFVHALVTADRSGGTALAGSSEGQPVPVLDWRLVALVV